MKKKVVSIIVVFVITLLAGWNMAHQKEEVQLSDLALENVEALANCEINGWASGDWRITIYAVCIWDCRRGGVLSCPY